MKLLKLIFLLLIPFWYCSAQETKLLIQQQPIEDLTKYPFYQKLVDKTGTWKPEYQYLDSIEIYTITYLSDGLKVNGLMAKPKQEGNFPCIIYNRGGNRDFGQLVVAHGALLLGNLAKEGYVVMASQYRGNGGSEGQEEFGGSDVNDVLILTEVLKEIEGADTERIGMYGWSRGGMMTYLALSKTDKIKTAVVGGAISDLEAMIEDRPEMETGVLSEVIPQYQNNKALELEKRSAIKWAEKLPENTPLLILHGNADWRVKCDQSIRMALELDKLRKPYRLVIFEGADHGISEHRAEVNDLVSKWFTTYLKGESLPNMEYHGR